MVRAELTIEITKNDKLRIGLDLLKREDWKEDEWNLANNLQEYLMFVVNAVSKSGLAKLTKKEIIKEPEEK